MAVPVLEASEPSATDIVATSFVMDAPAGIVPGELLTLIVGNDSTLTDSDFNDISGWSKQYSHGGTSPDTWITLYTRIADGTEGATVTVTCSNSRRFWGCYARWSSVDTTRGTHGVSKIGIFDTRNGTEGICESLNTVDFNCLAVAHWSFDGGDGSPFINPTGTGWPTSIPADQTTYSQAPDPPATSGTSGGFLTKEMPLQAASNNVTIQSAESDGWTTIQFAISGVQPPNNLPVLEAFQESEGSTTPDATAIAPAGITAGELLIILAANDSTSNDKEWGPTPAGWHEHWDHGSGISDTHMVLYSKIADGTEGDVTISDTGNRKWIFYMRWSNVATWAGFNGIVAPAGEHLILATTDLQIPSLDMKLPEVMAVAAWSYDGSDGWPFTKSPVQGAGWPDLQLDKQYRTNTGATGCSGGFILKEMLDPGASGIIGIMGDAGSDGMVGVQFAIQGALDPWEYPKIGGSASTNQTNGTTSPTFALPPDIEAGDGLLMLIAIPENDDFTDLNGFTELYRTGDSELQGQTFVCVYKVATGNEGSSVTFQSNDSIVALSHCLRLEALSIENWGTTPPQIGVLEAGSATRLMDPPLITAAWGADYNTWIVFACLRYADSLPDPQYDEIPLNSVPIYGNFLTVGGSFRLDVQQADDPAATFDSDRWAYHTTVQFTIGTIALKPSPPITEHEGSFSLDAKASLEMDGEYVPALFTGQFALTGEATVVDADGFFFEDEEGDVALTGEAALTMTGEAEPPVYNSWFSLGAEAALDMAGVAEVEGEFSLGAEADISFKGSFISVGGGVPVLAAEADITFTGEYSAAQFAGDVPLEAEATLAFVGEHTPPVFTGQFILGAVASISAEALFLPLRTGEFSLAASADFGMWAQVPLQPGTGSSVLGDRATPTKVWSLEDPTTVEGEDDPTKVKGRQ